MTDRELAYSLRAYCRRRRFYPFILEFASGLQVTINHPDQIAPLGDVWHYRGPKRAQSLFPSSSVCRLLDITEAEK